jgi:hypothetical protein
MRAEFSLQKKSGDSVMVRREWSSSRSFREARSAFLIFQTRCVLPLWDVVDALPFSQSNKSPLGELLTDGLDGGTEGASGIAAPSESRPERSWIV